MADAQAREIIHRVESVGLGVAIVPVSCQAGAFVLPGDGRLGTKGRRVAVGATAEVGMLGYLSKKGEFYRIARIHFSPFSIFSMELAYDSRR